MPTGTPASKKGTPRVAAGTAASKPTGCTAEKKVVAAAGGSGAAASSGSSATTHSTTKSGGTGKTPRKSVEGGPGAGRRASNSSTGTSSGHEKSTKGTKTGAAHRAAAVTQKQATTAAAAGPAADASSKDETCSAVESQPPTVPAATPAADEASAPAPCKAAAAADDGEVDVASSSHSDANEKTSQNTGVALATDLAGKDAQSATSVKHAAASNAPLICLLGPPCSGKGTLSHLMKRELGLEHISTGDLLREAAKEQGENSQVGELMKSGGLVPDDVVADLLKKALDRLTNSRGALLDGFPRNSEQVKLMDELQLWPRMVLVLKVPSDVLRRRMAARRLDPLTGEVFGEGYEPQDEEQRQRLIQRDDDRPEILQKRLDEYAEKVDGILSSFKEVGGGPKVDEDNAKRSDTVEDEQEQSDRQQRCKIVEIDGDRDIMQIFGEVSSALERINVTKL